MRVKDVCEEVYGRFEGKAPMSGESVNLPLIIHVTLEVLSDHGFVRLEKKETKNDEHK